MLRFRADGRRGLAPTAGSSALLILLALMVLRLAPGCARKPKPEPIAFETENRAIPLSEFERAFWAAQKADTSLKADTTSLRKFVSTYTDHLLQETLAWQAVPKLTGDPANNLEGFREGIIVDALRQDAYGKAFEVNPADLRHAYDLLSRRLHLQFMVVGDRAEAEQIVYALKEGAVFDKVAAQKSLDTQSRGSGGDIGWILYTDLEAGIRDPIFSAKVGDVIGPLPSGDQFQIFKVKEEQPNDKRGTLEAERPKLELGIKLRQVSAAQSKYQQDLLDKYRYHVDPVQLAWMTARLHDQTASVHRGLPPGSTPGSTVQTTSADELPWKGAPVAPADTGRVLATFDPPRGKIKPLLVIDQLMESPAMAWPSFDNTKDLESIIRKLVLERVELREAEARGIEKRPDVAGQITEQENQIRTRVWFRTTIRARARPSDDMARAYYDVHRSEFVHPERRRFLGLATEKWDTAVKAGDLLRAGRKMSEVGRELSRTDPSVKTPGDTPTDPLTFGLSPMLDRFIFTLPLNGVSDPIPIGNGFTVAKVVEIDQAGTQPFDEVKESIREKLGTARVDSILKVVLDDARPHHTIKAHWDVIRQARLKSVAPPPTSGSSGPHFS